MDHPVFLHVDLKKSISASLIDKKLKNLKWITPDFSDNPQKEIEFINEALNEIRKNKMVMTHHQFFSVLLEENLNIPNRWYTHDNNSYPLKNHKYFNFYKKHFSENLLKNKIEIIYTVGDPVFEDYMDYIENMCFDKINLNTITNIYEVKNCS